VNQYQQSQAVEAALPTLAQKKAQERAEIEDKHSAAAAKQRAAANRRARELSDQLAKVNNEIAGEVELQNKAKGYSRQLVENRSKLAEIEAESELHAALGIEDKAAEAQRKRTAKALTEAAEGIKASIRKAAAAMRELQGRLPELHQQRDRLRAEISAPFQMGLPSASNDPAWSS
jgi:hypothetical protein